MESNTFKIIWFFFEPYKLQVLVLLVLSLAVGALEAASVAVIYPLLSAAFDTGFAEGNVILSTLQRVAGLLPIEDEFIGYCVLFLLFALLAFAIRFPQP